MICPSSNLDCLDKALVTLDGTLDYHDPLFLRIGIKKGHMNEANSIGYLIP